MQWDRISWSEGPRPLYATQTLHCTQSFSTAASLGSLLCLGVFWIGGFGGLWFLVGGLGFFLLRGRIQRPPDTLEEVMVLFKAHITPREQCCMGLLTLPFSLTFHHKILGLNMTVDNVLLASINTLEQRMWGVLHRFFATCFTDISTSEKQSLLCTNVGFGSVPILKAMSLKTGMLLCFKKWYNLSMEHV